MSGASAPDGVTLLPADVTEEDGVRAALARIDDDGQQLRLAVNCAGIAPSARIVSRRGPHDLELFRTVVGVNLVGTFNVLRLAADAMSRLPADADGQRGVDRQHRLDRGVRGPGRAGGLRGVEGAASPG